MSGWSRFVAFLRSRPDDVSRPAAWVRWHDLALSQHIERSDVYHALRAVVTCLDGVDAAWLIAELRQARDVVAGPVRITHEGRDAVVALHGPVLRCPREALLVELERLRARHAAPRPPTPSEAESDHLLSLASTHPPQDPALADAWRFVLDGIRFRCIGPADLDMVIETTRHRLGFGRDEYCFDFEPEDEGQLRITLVQDSATCPPDAMLAELETLRRRYLDSRNGE